MIDFKKLCRENVAKNEVPGFNVRDEYKHLSIEELQNITSKDRLPYAVCALNITGDLNVSVMMRTAHLLGAEKFIIMGRRKYDKRATVGAQNYISVDRISAFTRGLKIDKKIFNDYMTTNRYRPIFVEQNGFDISPMFWENIMSAYRMYPNHAHKICFVYGNEGIGIDQELMEGHTIVSIPQKGVMRSLNVSSAMAIVTYDYVSKVF